MEFAFEFCSRSGTAKSRALTLGQTTLLIEQPVSLHLSTHSSRKPGEPFQVKLMKENCRLKRATSSYSVPEIGAPTRTRTIRQGAPQLALPNREYTYIKKTISIKLSARVGERNLRELRGGARAPHNACVALEITAQPSLAATRRSK